MTEKNDPTGLLDFARDFGSTRLVPPDQLPPRPPLPWPLKTTSDPLPKVRGDALDTIWMRGRQWAVTSYGMEALNGLYAIDVDRLLGGVQYLPHHMHGKTWVDIDDFAVVFCVAVAMHTNPAVLAAFGRRQS